MKSRSRTVLMAGLIAACTVMGCQNVPFLSANQLRTVVNYGTTDFDSNASLSVTLNIEPLLALTKRKVLANVTTTASGTSSPTECPAQIVATITGQNSGYRSQQNLPVSNFKNGIGTIEFYDLPADTYTVTVVAEDAAGKALRFATQSGVIVDNTLSPVVHLQCKNANGTLTIDWNCQDTCDASPSVAPYTPPPTLLGPVYDAQVDSLGNIYLIGEKPLSLQTTNFFGNGRIIRVLPNLTVESNTTPFYDAFASGRPYGNAAVFGHTLYLPEGYVTELPTAVDTSTFPGTLVKYYPAPSYVGANYPSPVAVDNNGDFIAVYFGGFLFDRTKNYDDCYFTSPNHEYDVHRLAFDSGNSPIWTCNMGICGVPIGYPNNTIPNLLAALPPGLQSNTGGALGIAKATAGSSKFLVTYDGDTRIFLWDESSNLPPAPVFDFAPDFPRNVVLAPNGRPYVLVEKAGTFGHQSIGATASYHVVSLQFDNGTNTLSNPQLLVATY